MASNSFGSVFRMTTWGESHGPAIGVVVDGCPAGIPLTENVINAALARRAPGGNRFTSPRSEADRAEILSGVFSGVTTGAPLSIVIRNRDADSRKYDAIAALLRPGHANFTYLKKYGVFDYRGGGRASARETACRVAAGAVAGEILAARGIRATACLTAVGRRSAGEVCWETAMSYVDSSVVFAPDKTSERDFCEEIESALREHDSVGGIVSFAIDGVPAGLGDPVYEKLDARLAFALLGIPACKGFEIGNGFASALLRGSQNNDAFRGADGNKTVLESNRAGGVLGGISAGERIYGRVAFKPTPSIGIPQKTVDTQGTPAEFRLPPGSRHDPCVAVRAVPVVEAMCNLVIADALLLQAAADGGR